MKRSFFSLALGLVLAALLLMYSPISQADGSVSGQVGFTILPTQMLTVLGRDNTGGQSVTSVFKIPGPSAADLAQGFIERERETVLVVQSNIPWRVSVRTPDADMGRSTDGRYLKPISDLQVRAQGRSYLTVSHEAQVIARGSYGRYELGVGYRVKFNDTNYRPGDYHITLIYTISGD